MDGALEPEIVTLGAEHMQVAAGIRRVALWQRLPWLPDLHTPEEEERYWRMHLLPNCTILGAPWETSSSASSPMATTG